ncbi:hypothetical protein CDAR_390202 [Caerostris darwini]|uniref:Uncharacterized protein n=1 Tax=Caerostris darwini TaxID=1538125 RepID=A0AAV4P0R3_9ARAC|nr:hypothetical protein CDAR_390202 [Caerostris darwini]
MQVAPKLHFSCGHHPTTELQYGSTTAAQFQDFGCGNHLRVIASNPHASCVSVTTGIVVIPRELHNQPRPLLQDSVPVVVCHFITAYQLL